MENDMNKLLLTTALFGALIGTSAFAGDFNLDVNLGGAPAAPTSVVIGTPAIIAEPVFVDHGPSYDPYHRDHEYWAHKAAHDRWLHEKRERERREHERHEEHHDHDRDHHDDHRY
jgi:hypothetical protein